jgi:hypothetical protein
MQATPSETSPNAARENKGSRDAAGPITLGNLLAGLPDSIRSEVVAKYRENGFRVSEWGRAEMFGLSEAIFQVENKHEHALAVTGTAPSSPRMAVVRRMNVARNRLLDALGENEYTPRSLAARAAAPTLSLAA